jgi:hypothetical protein
MPKTFTHRLTFCVVFTLLLLTFPVLAQPPAAPGPDTIIFPNGDKLSGHFISATGSAVKFKSDALGDLTIDWSKIQELHTAEKVAIIRKGVELSKHANPSSVPQGTLTVENQNAQVAAPPQPAQSIPLSDTSAIVDQPSFERALTQKPGFLADWAGTVTAGASLVNATQDNRTFNGAVSLVRAEPAETWLSPSNRTSVDFSATYGDISQPNTPTIKTSIFHGDAERDEYFTDGVFAFGRADFDHNYSQGLNLQQTYSGGIGWTAIQTSNQTLDVKGGMSYVRQQFQAGPDQSLIGSIIGEHYNRTFKRGLVLDQHLTLFPAWNNLNAYSALFSTMFTLPVYKRVSASTGIIDTFLNDPPPGFQKNSFQFNFGLTYVLR